MSEEQLKAFLEKAKGDISLQEKLKAAKSPDDVVGIAKEHGHEFATSHLTQLSEKEIERLAGGFMTPGGTGVCDVETYGPSLLPGLASQCKNLG
jgi:predicted ribosomally synthesized peptide with nif11-like leader